MRNPFSPITSIEPLKPVAAPIDTYFQPPQVPKDNNLRDMAQALSGLDSGLTALLQARQDKQDSEDKVTAERDFHANNAVGYAEAVRTGAVPPNASKAYVETYKQTEGDIAGAQLEAKFRSAYSTWDGRGSNDPNAFNNFLGSFIRENVKSETDTSVLKGLLPRLRQLSANGMAIHIADEAKIAKERMVTSSAAQADQNIESAAVNGKLKGEAPDWGAVVGQIHADREAKLKVGADPEQLDKVYIDAVTTQAEKRGGDDGRNLLKEFFNSTVPGKDYTWANTPYGRQQLEKTYGSIDREDRRQQVEDKRLKAEQNKVALDGWTRKTISAIVADPTKPVPEDLIREGERYDADVRMKVIEWRNKLLTSGSTSDPKAMLGLQYEIMNGGGMGAVRRAMENGDFKSKEDLMAAFNLATKLDENKGRVNSLFALGSVTSALGTIKQQLTPNDKNASFFNPEMASNEALSAMHDFRMSLIDWAMKNPNAGPMETEKAVAEITANITGRIKSSGDIMRGNAYNRPADAGPSPLAPTPQAPAPVQPQAQPQATPPAPPPAAPQAPAPTTPQPEKRTEAPVNGAIAMSWFNSLPLEQQAIAAEHARRTGKGLDQLVNEAYQLGVTSGRIKPDTSADQPKADKMSYDPNADGATSPPEDTPVTKEVHDRVASILKNMLDTPMTGYTPQGNYTIATLKNDPRASKILDFVAGPESRGNYNAYYGNAGSQEDLSQYSFDQIMAQARARGKRYGSSATGRYQFMSATMKDLKETMGLSGSEKFTPELQDKMALQLLIRRGYGDWKDGKLSNEAFANNLAMEWASLPRMDTGRSHYAGDAIGNKHLVSPRQVQAALTGAITDAGPQAAPQDQTSAKAPQGGLFGPNDIYANIPEKEVKDFLKWNPDPVAAHSKHLNAINPDLKRLYEKVAADNPNLKFIIGDGVRDQEKQKMAVDLGWSKTMKSKHSDGSAMDIWPLDANGRVAFNKDTQLQIRAAMLKAANELGIQVKTIDWDLPHIELAAKGDKAAWPRVAKKD